MVKPVIPARSGVKPALREVVSAHAAILKGIASHAEKHRLAIDARREEVGRQNAIRAGIDRQSGKV